MIIITQLALNKLVIIILFHEYYFAVSYMSIVTGDSKDLYGNKIC